MIAKREFKLLWPGEWAFPQLDNAATHDSAAIEARRAFELSPDSLFAQTAMARTFMTSGQFAEAAVVLGRILREQPMGETYWRDYGFSLLRSGRFDEADQVFAGMIKKKQMMSFAFYMRHFIALERRDRVAAGEFLLRALEIEPTNADYRAARERFDQTGGK